jgi:hypothetical protein
MTSEELAVAGVPPTGEDTRNSGNVQSRADDPTAGTIPDSGIRKEGEIRSEDRFGGKEDLSNVDADVNELVRMKTRSYPPAFVFGESEVIAELIKEYEKAEFSLSVMHVPPLVNKYLLSKQMKWLFSGLLLDSDSLVIIFCLHS